MAGLPPVSKEQAVLESYFLSLSKFAFDKAKDIAVSYVSIAIAAMFVSLLFFVGTTIASDTM